MKCGLRSVGGDAEAVGDGEGELSETGRRLKAEEDMEMVVGIRGGIGRIYGCESDRWDRKRTQLRAEIEKRSKLVRLGDFHLDAESESCLLKNN